MKCGRLWQREERITRSRANKLSDSSLGSHEHTRGAESSPLTAPEEASPTGWIGEIQGTSSCRRRKSGHLGLTRCGQSWGHPCQAPLESLIVLNHLKAVAHCQIRVIKN